MSDQTPAIASLCASTLQSLIVFAANFLTIAVKQTTTNLHTSYQFGRSRSFRWIRIRDTCICFDLAASSSNNKHEDVHLRCRRRLVSRCFFGFINLAG